MSGELPLFRPEPVMDEVIVSAPVRGRLAREVAHLMHYARAHGMNVIPAHRPGLELSTGDANLLVYAVEPSGYAIARMWIIGAHQPEPSGEGTAAQIRISTPDGTTPTDRWPWTGTGFTPSSAYLWIVVEPLKNKSRAFQALPLILQRISGTATVTIESVACWELPRAVLSLDTYDRGVDLETLHAGQAVYDGLGASLSAIASGLYYTWPRRSLVQWSGPPLEVTSTEWINLTLLAEPCLPHRHLRADTHLTCRWTVVYRTSASTVGEVRITTGIDGTTDTGALPEALSYVLMPVRQISVRCENPTTEDGLPAGGWESVQMAVRRTSGSGTIWIYARCVWEPHETEDYLLLEDGDFVLLEDGGKTRLE